MVLPDHRPGERGGCRSRPLLASCVPDTTTVESEMAAEQSDVIIELDKVYKIFGPQPRGRALQLAKSGMKKNDVQAQTEHVVGMTNVSFQVSRGETFVIMGLSGSGKSTAIRTVNKLHDITDGMVIVDGVDVQALDGPRLVLERVHELQRLPKAPPAPVRCATAEGAGARRTHGFLTIPRRVPSAVRCALRSWRAPEHDARLPA